MTLLDIISALGPSGLGAAALGLAGLSLKIYAWRMAVRDKREHAARLAAATTDQQRAIVASNPPPPLPDQLLKILVVCLLGGLALACAGPAHRVAVAVRGGPSSRCVPKCRPDETCEGRICTKLARPSATAQSAPPAPQSPPPSPGPQSSVSPVMATQRWTDGKDPFESESCQ